MKITVALKAWLVDNAGAAKDASDETCIGLVAQCLTKAAGEDGHMSPEKLVELTADEKVKAANEFTTKLDTLVDVVGKLATAVEAKQTPAAAPVETVNSLPQDELIKSLVAKIAQTSEVGEGQGEDAGTVAPATKTPDVNDPSFMEKLFAGAGNDGSPTDDKGSKVRVKGAHEQYSDTKSAAVYPAKTAGGYSHSMAGQQVCEGQRPIDHASKLDKAIAGVWAKYQMSRENSLIKLNDHDVDLLKYTIHNYKFGGVIGGEYDSGDGTSIGVNDRKLRDLEVKTLLDDSGGGLSGGLEIAPIVFDDQIILPSLLFGELFPKVTVKTITRGRRIEGAEMSQVTIASGGADDSAISLFNTSGFISAFDTTIFVAEGAVEIGNDFISDSPIAIANSIVAQYGQVLMVWLDDVIADGDGSTQPEGVMRASSTVNVGFGGVAPTLGVYESLNFGIAKPYKGGTDKGRIVFCGTETSYKRARSIPVGATDARRIGGSDLSSYEWMGHPFALNESLANTQQFFANLSRYRMYRRLGITFRTETGGKDLALRNKTLITMRARFGGQMETGAAAAVTTTALA